MSLSHIYRIFCSVAMAALFVASAAAMSPEEAREAFEQGDYAEAAPTLCSIADAAPRNAQAHTMAGIALMRSGNIAAARKYLAKGTAEAKIYLAEIAFLDYDFDGAEELLDSYEASLRKGRRKVADPLPQAGILRSRIATGRAMLDRVEKIAVIDSMSVPAEEFFSFYRLASSAGRLASPSVLPQGMEAADPTAVYVTPDDNTAIWATTDSAENYVLVQSSRLADGSWEAPTPLGSALNEGGDVNYPFLMSDGVTLYFAGDGAGSLGGYDIFISRNDGEKYLQPQNLGMPYNSPFNDYMLAIDEETGIGWWATDRNGLTDSVTIYRFIPQELRINYPPDTENLAALALLKEHKATLEPGSDYSELIARSNNAGRKRTQREAELQFGLPDGSVRTSVESFHSAQARTLVREYLEETRRLKETTERLARLRAEYSQGNTGVGNDILSIESELPAMRGHLRSLRSMIAQTEL